jgi:hypothetical protein
MIQQKKTLLVVRQHLPYFCSYHQENSFHHTESVVGTQLLTLWNVAAHIESRGFTPLLDILHQLGGWPVLDGDTWNAGNFDWRQSVFNFKAMGYSVDYFIDFSVSTDAKNSSYRSINVSYLRTLM